MLLLNAVLPSIVLRGSCDLKGKDFQLWIASLGLRGEKKINLNFCFELCIRGCTKPSLRDVGKIFWIIYFMISLQLPFLEKMCIKEAQQTCAQLNETSSLSYHTFRLIVPRLDIFLSFSIYVYL